MPLEWRLEDEDSNFLSERGGALKVTNENAVEGQVLSPTSSLDAAER